MPSTLVIPDGVRLAERHELPGPESERAQVLSSIQSAEIAPGSAEPPRAGGRPPCLDRHRGLTCIFGEAI
jgi:hypothetical protein